jgi:FlaG/FlaF family flagellin (archaellin)
MKANSYESAVSEVIGEVLILALVVLLAAVIGAMVFGLAGSIQKTTISGVTATRNTDGFVMVTYHGGEEANQLHSLNITVNGSGYGIIIVSLNAGTTPLDVGNSTMLRAPAPGMDHVVVVGNFADGRQQLFLDTVV